MLGLLALSFSPIALCIPKFFGYGTLAAELGYRTVDCHSSHNGDNTVFLLTSVHVEQHLKCTSHNLILLGYKIRYQRVTHRYAK